MSAADKTKLNAALQLHQPQIAQLCRRFRVTRLDVFGSAAGERFDSDHSDIDLLVEFEPMSAASYADAFFALKEALELLFGRSVDLIVPSAVRNPYFRRSIEQNKTLLYAA